MDISKEKYIEIIIDLLKQCDNTARLDLIMRLLLKSQ